MKIQISYLLLAFSCFQVVATKPVSTKTTPENYYQFWKTVYKKLIPQTQALQKLTSEVIDSMCYMKDIVNGQSDNQSCEEYLESVGNQLSLPTIQDKTSNKQNVNTNKFMKVLIKSTLNVLNQYIDPVNSLLNDLNKDDLCIVEDYDDIDICQLLTVIDTNYRHLTQTLSTEMKAYYNIRKVSGKSLGMEGRSRKEKIAILFSLLNQLKEAEAALEFVVKSTWDVHIQKMANFGTQRIKIRRLSKKLVG